MKKTPILFTPSGPCEKDCKDRSETCHSSCPKYLQYKEDLKEFKKRQKEDRNRYDTMSDDSKRRMWREKRYSRTIRVNRGPYEG